MKAKPEILGSVRRRRDWTPAEKARVLEEALQPGATVASVADKHGISRGLFYQWMAKARAGLLPGVAVNGLPTPRFVPVRLEQMNVPARTSLEEVAEWAPRKPEEILDIKVCDPAMGSGSFPVSALRYITDALVQSLYHHRRIELPGDGSVARLADGKSATKISDQLIPLPPEHEAFEETLRAQLKRHVVERCIYGVDIPRRDPER